MTRSYAEVVKAKNKLMVEFKKIFPEGAMKHIKTLPDKETEDAVEWRFSIHGELYRFVYTYKTGKVKVTSKMGV